MSSVDPLPIFYCGQQVYRDGHPVYVRLETEHTTRQYYTRRDGRFFLVRNPPPHWLTVKLEKVVHTL
jgi:hypothetical protein